MTVDLKLPWTSDACGDVRDSRSCLVFTVDASSTYAGDAEIAKRIVSEMNRTHEKIELGKRCLAQWNLPIAPDRESVCRFGVLDTKSRETAWFANEEDAWSHVGDGKAMVRR